MSHKHNLNTYTPDFTIDPITREIIQVSNPENPIRLMQFDHNSEKLRFSCPRYIDGHDMALCDKLEVHFVNSDVANAINNSGAYRVVDLEVDSADSSKINFSWVVSKNATGNVGTLVFSVRFTCLSGDEIDYVWHTLSFTYISVEQGLVSEIDPEYQKIYLDNLETEAGKKVVEAGEATATALEAAERASAAINDLYEMDVTDKSPAIVCGVVGKTIQITDSAEMPIKGLRVFGKSVQDDTPTPASPVEIESVESPTVTITDGTADNVQNIVIGKTLHGIPVTSGGNYTDENGHQWICDEVDLERGVCIQRVYKLLSTYGTDWLLSGSSTTNHNSFYRINRDIPVMVKGTNHPTLCSHFQMTEDGRTDTTHVICGWSNQEVYFFVPKSDFPDVETWTRYVVDQANAGTPITTYYVLETPIETPLTETEIAAYKALHTNYPNTVVMSEADVEVKYAADTKLYIDKKIKELVTALVNN